MKHDPKVTALLQAIDNIAPLIYGDSNCLQGWEEELQALANAAESVKESTPAPVFDRELSIPVDHDEQDTEEPEPVTLIASGYEWTCPNCETYNRLIETKPSVTCSECKRTYDVDEAIHALG